MSTTQAATTSTSPKPPFFGLWIYNNKRNETLIVDKSGIQVKDNENSLRIGSFEDSDTDAALSGNHQTEAALALGTSER